MELSLTANEVRVLGSLVEKDITTPEYYPLSLNALLNACNQKSNRDPYMQLGDGPRPPCSVCCCCAVRRLRANFAEGQNVCTGLSRSMMCSRRYRN